MQFFVKNVHQVTNLFSRLDFLHKCFARCLELNLYKVVAVKRIVRVLFLSALLGSAILSKNGEDESPHHLAFESRGLHVFCKFIGFGSHSIQMHSVYSVCGCSDRDSNLILVVWGALCFFEFLLTSLVAFASHEYLNSPLTCCPFTHSHSTHSPYQYYSSSSINLASQRHQHSSWARVTKSKPKRERGRLIAKASTRNSNVLMQ